MRSKAADAVVSPTAPTADGARTGDPMIIDEREPEREPPFNETDTRRDANKS